MMEQIEHFSNLYDAACVVNECIDYINRLEQRIRILENMHHDKSEDDV